MSNQSKNSGAIFAVQAFVSVVMTLIFGGALMFLLVDWCIDFDGEMWLPKNIKDFLAQARQQSAVGLELKTPPSKRTVALPTETVHNVAPKSHIDINKSETCSDCHEVIDADGASPIVGRLLPFTACLVCHPAKEFAVTHGHVFEPLQDCELCHALHGSTVKGKGLLSAPREFLCNACHDGDH
ncbi:MAG: cytochrome c3 family protein [Thermoguttaceae bacterium]